MTTDPLRIMVLGAHPDDCDFTAGGVAALYSRAGHQVRFVSLTNGDAGHYNQGGAPLAWRRRLEAQASAKTLGIEYLVLDHHDGMLLPTLEAREQVIAVIREFQPDAVLAPRPWDYHPDHRYCGQLVADALYMVTVPNAVSRVPHLRRNPVALLVADHFQRPYPFTPDIVVGIDEVFETKVDAMACHESQFYEWIPYNMNCLDQVPAGAAERRAWFRQWIEPMVGWQADRWRDQLVAAYGEAKGRAIRYVEAFEVCEYGAQPSAEELRRLFPFF